MDFDLRHNTAEYYDRLSEPPGDDVSFYLDRLPGPGARVLELGCGTGRVLLPMARRAGYTLGVDLSPAMLDVCNRKLRRANIPPARAQTLCADISTLGLADSETGFDRVCAPFRVMQNLEADEQVDGLIHVIKRHLSPGGEAVLNTFKPRGGFDVLAANWSTRDGSSPNWTKPLDGDTVTMSDDCTVFEKDPVRVYPKLIYRRYNPAGEQIDESILSIVMRVWQPDELIAARHAGHRTLRRLPPRGLGRGDRTGRGVHPRLNRV